MESQKHGYADGHEDNDFQQVDLNDQSQAKNLQQKNSNEYQYNFREQFYAGEDMHEIYSHSGNKNNYYAAEYDYMNKSGTDNQSEEDLDHHTNYAHNYADDHYDNHYDQHYGQHYDQHYDQNHEHHDEHNFEHHEQPENCSDPNLHQELNSETHEEFNKVHIEDKVVIPTHGYLKIILVCEPVHLVIHADTIEEEIPKEPCQISNEDSKQEIKEDQELKEVNTIADEVKEEVENTIIIPQPQEVIKPKKIISIDLNDPYCNHVEDESVQLIYDQLREGAIPEADLSFEFEPAFEPK